MLRPFAAVLLLATAASAAEYTAIRLGHGPDHEVRYASGKLLYVEGLVDGRWCGRFWAADGRLNFPYWRFAEPSFQLGLKTAPEQTNETFLTDGWIWVGARELSKTGHGARHFAVDLRHPLGLNLRLHTLVDETPVLVRWLELVNTSERPLAITTLSPWSGRLWDAPGLGSVGPYEVSSSYPWMSFAWKRLPEGETVIENEYANGYDDPFFMARNVAAGNGFICHLAWSANYRIRFACNTDPAKPKPGLTFAIGLRAREALRVLDPGETATTPAVHLGHVAGDLDDLVQAMHEHIRRSVLPKRDPQRAWRIQYNTPGDQGYFTGQDFNETNLRKCIDVAAAIGCELFLVDCPWYDHYGEWVPSPTRFPHGLQPLVAYAHRKGLLFGLQTEVEGGRSDWSHSRVRREHPDWFGDQNIMRLDRPEVAEYMKQELLRVAREYQPDLYRNEFIPNPSRLHPETTFYVKEWESRERHGFRENAFWRYYQNWYRVFEDLRQAYPKLVLQQCANCGTREDLGTISRFDESNTAEGPPANMIGIVAGKTLCLPPEILEIGYGTAKERGPLDTYLRVTYTLTMPQHVTGIAPSLEELNPVLLERSRHYAALYKDFIRPLLPVSRVFHHNPSFAGSANPWADPWFAMEYASPDGQHGWATIVQRARADGSLYVFRPRGVRRDRSYRLTFDSTGATVILSGHSLSEQGLTLRLAAVLSSELLLYEALPAKGLK